MRNPQLNKHGELQHLLTLDGLPREIVTTILDTARPSPQSQSAKSRSCP